MPALLTAFSLLAVLAGPPDPVDAPEPKPETVEGGAAQPEEPTTAAPTRIPPTQCTYKTYQWSVKERRAVNRRTVKKAYKDLTADEKAPDFEVSGCTVCQEDQVTVQVGKLPAIEICWYYAPKVQAALEAIVASDEFRIDSLVGYRCGQTRGRVVDGKRTEFSNHSYGTAIDINARSNGLYRRCNLKGKVPASAKDIARCKKGMGGVWDPARRPKRTITRESIVYRLFTEQVGWQWGGEIDGRLKDFMHFSPDGR